MRKKQLIFTSLSIMLLMVLAVGAGTFALFTDTATNEGNNIKAGTVIISEMRDMGDTFPGPMFYSAASDPTGSYPADAKTYPYPPPGYESPGGWAPGDIATRAMDLYNHGTLDVYVTHLKAEVHPEWIAPVSGEVFTSETEGLAYDEFISNMNIKVQYPAQNKVLYNGPLSGLLNDYVDFVPFLIKVQPSGPANITFEATLDNDTGNAIQGKNFIFDFTFKAEQSRNNP